MKLSEMREKSVDELQSAIVDWKNNYLNQDCNYLLTN